MKRRAEAGMQTLAAVVGILLIFSLAFFYLYQGRKVQIEREPEYYDYNEFRFVKQGPLWVTQVQSGKYVYTIRLHYGPRDLEDVKVSGIFSQKFADANYVYLSFEPENVQPVTTTVGDSEEGGEAEESKMILAASELSIILSQAIRRNPIAACTRNETAACNDRPIVPCNREGEPVIYLVDRGEASVRFMGDCIGLTGEGDEIVKAVDRLLLFWLGVMP